MRNSGFPEERIFAPGKDNIKNIIPEEGFKVGYRVITKEKILELTVKQQFYVYSLFVLKSKPLGKLFIKKSLNEIFGDKWMSFVKLIYSNKIDDISLCVMQYLTLANIMSLMCTSKNISITESLRRNNTSHDLDNKSQSKKHRELECTGVSMLFTTITLSAIGIGIFQSSYLF